jgi:phosphonate transport system permease protein
MSNGFVIYFLLFLAFVFTMADFGFFRTDRLPNGISNLIRFTRDAFPPDFTSLDGIQKALFETIEMAFAGTFLGFLISFPLAILGSRLLFPTSVVAASRFIAAFLRTVPPLLWAILFVIITGLGPLAGTLSLAFYTVGYLSKLYSEFFEGTDPEVLEAVKGAGATTPYLVRYVVLPEQANAILSQLLFMFEYNIRASSILGFVGAGGIGFQIYVYLQTMEYQKLAAVLILILAIVLLMDFAGEKIRRRYLLV